MPFSLGSNTSMRRKRSAPQSVSVARYATPDQPAVEWRFEPHDGGWRALSPDGQLSELSATLIECISTSGACEYETGVGLHIRTGGLISHFELLPALQSWTVPRESTSIDFEWWDHEVLGWAQEAINQRCGADQFELDYERIVLIDEAICAVHQADRDREKPGDRYLVLFEETDPMWPAFVEEWGTTQTDNGYGSTNYAVGEITPGFQGEVFDAGEIANLSIRPLPEEHTRPDDSEIVAWISGNVSMTAGFEQYELEVDGNVATAVFPEEGPYGEASGRIGPGLPPEPEPSQVHVTRYEGPAGPAQTWTFEETYGGWQTTTPDGAQGEPYENAVEALTASDACEYAHGIGLYIRTGGFVDPFDLLPALEGWTRPDDQDGGLDWASHNELGGTFELISSYASSAEFEMDPTRLIRVDDGFIGVLTTPSDSVLEGSRRHLVVFLETDPPRPEFYDEWAWTETDNGWVNGTHTIGEIGPGLVGEWLRMESEQSETLTVRPLPKSHPEGLYQQMIAWISDSISNTPGLEGFELAIKGDRVTAVFPDDFELAGEASGWLGPTARNSRKPI